MAVMTAPTSEVATADGVISTEYLRELVDGDDTSGARRRVLVIGDFAASAAELVPVLSALREDFSVDEAFGTSFRHAVAYDDGLLEAMAHNAHVIGHGAAAIALKHPGFETMLSLTIFAGFEPQPLPNFIRTLYGIIQGRRRAAQAKPGTIQDFYAASRHYMQTEEVLFHPLFNLSMLRKITRMSTLACLSTTKNLYGIPAISIEMAHDEYNPIPDKKDEQRAERLGVARRLIVSQSATHDYLITNPTMALTDAGFRQNL